LLNDIAALFRRKARIAQTYQAVFATPEGQAVLIDILKSAGLMSIAFEPGDPHRTAFNDGRRSLALEIVQKLRMPDLALIDKALAANTLDTMEQE
jgi:hypothetical protein